MIATRDARPTLGAWLALVLLVGVMAGPVTAGEPTETLPRLGVPADVVVELARYGVELGRPETTADGLRWTGGFDGVTVTVAGSDQAIRSAEISVDLIRAIGTDRASIGLAVQGWVAVFAPDAVEPLDQVLDAAAQQGLEVDRHLPLTDDRMLRVTIDRETSWLDLTVAQLDREYRLVGTMSPGAMCRGVDPVTRGVRTSLDLSFRATLEPTGGGGRHVWLVIAESRERSGAVQLADVGWDAAGQVADPATGTTVVPGPPIGARTTLSWTVRLADDRRHVVEHRLVEGPPPRAQALDLQAALVRDSIAFEVMPAQEFANDVCPEATGTGDPDVVMIREHVVAALLALELIDGRRPRGPARSGPRGLDRRLAVMSEVRDWAVAERAWAETSVAGHRWDHPVLRDWMTTVGALGVIATDLVATRLGDREAEQTAWRIVHRLITTMPLRITQDLAPPPSRDPADAGATPE